jgi:N-methylhydantoinase A
MVVLNAGCRYHGQNYEQDVAVSLDENGDLLASVLERFHAQHEATYGYRLPEAPMEIVYLSATAVDSGRRPLPPVELNDCPPLTVRTRRPVFFKEAGWIDTDVVRREMMPVGVAFAGPLVVEEPDSTVLVLGDQQVTLHATGALVLEDSAPGDDPGTRRELGALVG